MASSKKTDDIGSEPRACMQGASSPCLAWLACLGALNDDDVLPIILPVDAENGQWPLLLLGISRSLSHLSFFGPLTLFASLPLSNSIS